MANQEQEQEQEQERERAPETQPATALALIRTGYQERYEDPAIGTGDAWLSADANHRHLWLIAEWAERQAELQGESLEAVCSGWLDALFANPRYRKHRWPLKWAAENPAALLGAEQTGPHRLDIDPPNYNPAVHGEPREPKNYPAWNEHRARLEGSCA